MRTYNNNIDFIFLSDDPRGVLWLCNAWTWLQGIELDHLFIHLFIIICVYNVLFTESSLQSVNNLNEMDLCKESKISVHNFLILFVNLGNMFMIVVL